MGLSTTFSLRRSLGWLRWSELGSLFSDALSEWTQDKAQRLGASLAYYSLLSLAPLLVIAVAVPALIFGKSAVEGQLAWQIQSVVGLDMARVIEELIKSSQKPAAGVIATGFSLITLLFGASSAIVELHDALNTIWHVPSPITATFLGTFWSFLKERFFSSALVLGTGCLLLAGVVWSTGIALMGSLFGSFLPVPEVLLHLATFAVSFLAITIVFAALYKIVPNVRLKWTDVLAGAAVTSLLFTAGKQLIALYLGKQSFKSTYGAAGSVVMLPAWMYCSAQLFYFGAEFTKVYTRRYGSHRNAQTGAKPSPEVYPTGVAGR